jgi:hydroxypyruvate isomerase
MPKLSAHLSRLFTETGFAERFDAAAAAGFRGAEWTFATDMNAGDVRFGLEIAEMKPVLLDLCAEDDTLACDPARTGEFRETLSAALAFAKGSGFGALCVPCPAGGSDETFEANITAAARDASGAGLNLLIGPLGSLEAANALRERIGGEHVKLLFDIARIQSAGGDLSRRFDRHRHHIGHVRLAGVPDGQEPDRGEVRHEWLLEHFDLRGYRGWVGAAYEPAGRTEDGLAWAKPWL